LELLTLLHHHNQFTAAHDQSAAEDSLHSRSRSTASTLLHSSVLLELPASEVKVNVTLRLAVYRQDELIGDKPPDFFN
jgi:hypothetical protein